MEDKTSSNEITVIITVMIAAWVTPNVARRNDNFLVGLLNQDFTSNASRDGCVPKYEGH